MIEYTKIALDVALHSLKQAVWALQKKQAPSLHGRRVFTEAILNITSTQALLSEYKDLILKEEKDGS